MVAMALSAMDNNIVSTAIPQVVRDLGGFSLFSWVFSSYLLTQTVTIPVYGKLADLWGRKPILITGTLIFLAGSALCASAWSMVSLICFRGLQGLGAGSIMATVNTLAGDLYDLEERGRVQGWLSSVWGVSAVFGPTVGGSLAQYVSWRWIFVINLPLGAAAVALIGRFLHERVVRTRHRIDVAGAVLVLLAAGRAHLRAAAGRCRPGRGGRRPASPCSPWRRPRRWPPRPWSAGPPSRSSRHGSGAAGRWPGPGLASIGLGLLVTGPSVFLPTYGQAVLGLGAVAAGAVLATMSIGWPVASAVSGRFFLRLGFRDTELIGAAICLAAIVFFLLTMGYVQVWQPVVSTFVLGFGLGLISVCTLVGPQSTGDLGTAWGGHRDRHVLPVPRAEPGRGDLRRDLQRGPGRPVACGPARAGRAAAPAVNQVGAALTRVAGLGRAAAGYLRAAITAAIHDVYLGLALAALATLVAVLVLVPRRFATPGAAASAGPAGRAGPAEGRPGCPPAGKNPADHGGGWLGKLLAPRPIEVMTHAPGQRGR